MSAKLLIAGLVLMAAAGSSARADSLSAVNPADPDFVFGFSTADSIAIEKDLEADLLGASEETQLTGMCKSVKKKVGACDISFKVCGKLSKFKWKYDCKACASGKCAHAGGFKSAKGAAEGAAKKLFTAPLPACAIPPSA